MQDTILDYENIIKKKGKDYYYFKDGKISRKKFNTIINKYKKSGILIINILTTRLIRRMMIELPSKQLTLEEAINISAKYKQFVEENKMFVLRTQIGFTEVYYNGLPVITSEVCKDGCLYIITEKDIN